MSRATEATVGFICALLDEAGTFGGDYYREQFPEYLETAARAVADLLALVYPDIDNLHERQGDVVPLKGRPKPTKVLVSIGR